MLHDMFAMAFEEISRLSSAVPSRRRGSSPAARGAACAKITEIEVIGNMARLDQLDVSIVDRRSRGATTIPTWSLG